MQMRWNARTSRKAGAALRFCVALLLGLQIVYTPIHLYRVPHSDEADFSAAAPLASAAAFVGDVDHDGDGHHERHPAAQHKFKVLRSEQTAAAEMVLVAVVEWVNAEKDQPQPQVFDFSGLSPPELSRSWQFIFRAALPVRAPSLVS
jgi:hypothetical protein